MIPKPAQHCEHYEVCVMCNALLRGYLPKGEISYIWCEDTIRLLDGNCPHDTRSRPVSASPETCPHWVCIDHNDGDEWCCNRPAPTAPDALKQFLAELESIVARSTPDKGTLHDGWLLAYPIDRWISYQKKQLRQSQQGGERR
jgi:hypothetical protein